MRFFRRIASPFSEFGFLSGVLYLLDRGFARIGGRVRIYDYELMVQPIAERDMAPANFKKFFDVRQIERDDPLLAQMPPPENVIKARFAQHAICLGAFQRQRCIGYQWLVFGPYEEDEVHCTFVPQPAEHAVFDFDFYLWPDFRMGLGFVALWDGTNRFLRERGVRYTMSRVSRFNTASRTSHAHLGWYPAGRAVFVKGRRWQMMLASRSPYLHLSSSPSRRPRIEIVAES